MSLPGVVALSSFAVFLLTVLLTVGVLTLKEKLAEWCINREADRKAKKEKEALKRRPVFGRPAECMDSAYGYNYPRGEKLTAEQRLSLFPKVLDDPRMARNVIMWVKTNERYYKVEKVKCIEARFIDDQEVKVVFPPLNVRKEATIESITFVWPNNKGSDIKLITKPCDTHVKEGSVVNYYYTISLGGTDE